MYDSKHIDAISAAATKDRRIGAFIGYGSLTPPDFNIPSLAHLTVKQIESSNKLLTSHVYQTKSPEFVLPQADAYDAGNAALAHTRTLVFLRKHLGGPFFDLEAIWDEHTFFEFQERSVAKTMGTMVVSSS